MNNTYFNHASISPMLPEVREAIDQFLDRYMSADFHYYTTLCELSDRIRQLYAVLVGSIPQDIVLFPNSASAFSAVMMGYPFEEGDNVIVVENDFPSTSLPFTTLRKEKNLKVIVLDQLKFYADPVGELEKAITPKTRCFVTSSVGYMSGVRVPLDRLSETCRRHDVQIMVDGTQGVGVCPVQCSNWQIDFMVVSSYKWLMAPLGVAPAVISPSLRAQLQPSSVGWLSVNEPGAMLSVDAPLAEDARRFEPGGRPILAMVGLARSLDYLLEIGLATISEKTLDLSTYLYEQIQKRGYRLPYLQTKDTVSGIVSIVLEENGQAVFESLKSAGFVVTYRLGLLRFSPYFYQEKSDIDAVLSILDRVS